MTDREYREFYTLQNKLFGDECYLAADPVGGAEDIERFRVLLKKFDAVSSQMRDDFHRWIGRV